jgi:hypothetical protein
MLWVSMSLCFQGDLCIERAGDLPVRGGTITAAAG